MANGVFVYLVERMDETTGFMEPVGVFSTRELADAAADSYLESITSELELDKHYDSGIGIAEHWHRESQR